MDLVAPLIPNAQENKGPELFLQSLGQGLQAMSRFAEMKRQSESDMLRLAAQERMAQDEHQLGIQKLELETEMRDREMSINESLLPSRKAYFESVANTRKNATVAGLDFNRQRQDLINDVNDQAVKLKLDDPSFATKEPVQFAANVMQFEDMFRLSPLPEVKHAIKQYRTIADQQRIPLRIGAQLQDDEWKGGETKQIPIWQIIQKIDDPTTRDETMKALQASGHFNPGENLVLGVPTEQLMNLLKRGKGVKFETVPSRVPPAMLPKSAAAGTSPTEFTEPDLPVSEEANFTPTETDLKISHARAAIARGAPRDAVAKRLQEMGIDPSDL